MTSTMHVPAWKKLGLKLKNDQHASTESNGRMYATPLESGRLNGSNHHVEPQDPNRSINGHQLPSPAIRSLKPPNASDQSTAESSPNPRKRKSVSFTPETKTSDGLGFKHLYDQFLITHPNGKRPTFKPVVGTGGLSTFTSLDDSHKSKKAKKSKRSKESEPAKDNPITLSTTSLPVLPASTYNPTSDSSTKRPSKSKHHGHTDELAAIGKQSPKIDPAAVTETPIAKASPPSTLNGHTQTPDSRSFHLPSWLEYLYRHEIEPTAWKFSKTKQTRLLKSTFDVEKLPPDWDSALMHYWENSKGDSARAKLKEMAEKMIIDLDAEESVESSNASLPSESSEGAARTSPPSSIEVTEVQTIKGVGLSVEAIKAIRAVGRTPDDRLQRVADLDSTLRRKDEEYAKALIRQKKNLLRLAYEREEKKKEFDQAWQIRYVRRRRAEKILNALGGTGTSKASAIVLDNVNGDAAASTQNNSINKRNFFGGYEKVEKFNGTNEDLAKLKIHPVKKFARKRKRRTGVPDDDSSSSDALSLGSGGEEDLGGAEMQRLGIKKPGGWTADGARNGMEGKLREIKKLKENREKEIDTVSIPDSNATSSGVSLGSEDESESAESSESGGGSSESTGSSGSD